MVFRSPAPTVYCFWGMSWNEDFIPNASSVSMRRGIRLMPSFVSTSWVTIAQLEAACGQNQTNGMFSTFWALAHRKSRLSCMCSTVLSTGQAGKGNPCQLREASL